jgi:hypothetical protein
MKKVSKPVPKTPATKQSAAKPKAKSSSKSKRREAQGQAEPLPIVELLAQAAEQLTEASQPASPIPGR